MLTLVTAAASYPVSLSELKAHLAIDVSSEDDRLTALIAAATSLCETETQRAFVSQTWKLTQRTFPKGNLFLPKPPLSSVTSVKYYDADNVQQTWNSSNYYVCKGTKAQGFIEPVDAWPATYDRPDSVEVIFVAGGYAPTQVAHAIKVICGQFNEGREGKEDIPVAAKMLLNQLKAGIYL